MTAHLSGFGPFHLLDLLGEGSRATVYRARREGDDHEFALKLLHSTAADDDFESRATQERAAASMALRGDHLCQVTHQGVIDDRPYITMTLIHGLSLDKLAGKSGKVRLRPGQAAHVLEGVLRGLEHAWASSPPLVHGRLDEGAIMIGSDGNIALLGLGTPGPAQTDMLQVAQLAQGITTGWPTEMDAYFDKLQSADGFANVSEAIEALPVTSTERDKAGIGRLITRKLKATEETPEAGERVAPTEKTQEAQAPCPPPVYALKRRRRGTLEVVAASRQARLIALLCGSLVAIALFLELTMFPL